MKSLGKVGILGDSYSTFGGYVPEGYAVYYDVDSGENRGFVNDVNKTWWKQVVDKTGSNLVINSSYSGSMVCNFDPVKFEDRSSYSFITRMQADLSCEVSLDTILIFGCTNDLWRKATRSELKYEGHTKQDLNCLYPAKGFMLNYLRSNHSNARIIFITNPFFDEELTSTVQTACDRYNVEHLHLAEFERVEGHPTEKGMSQIANQVIEFVSK